MDNNRNARPCTDDRDILSWTVVLPHYDPYHMTLNVKHSSSLSRLIRILLFLIKQRINKVFGIKSA